MRKTYNFTNSSTNPYVKKSRKQVSLRLDIGIIDYFKAQAVETGIPYQNLINLYLMDCAAKSKTLRIA